MGKTSQVVQAAASRGATWLMPIAVGGPMALMIPVWAYGRKAGATALLFGIPHGKYVHVPVHMCVHTGAQITCKICRGCAVLTQGGCPEQGLNTCR